MADYILSCCSTADLSQEHLKSRNVPFVCFHFFLNEEEKLDDMGVTVPPKALFDAIKAGASARTAQVNAEEYAAFFRRYLQEGKDVLHVTLSSGISGTINSAQAAAALLQEEFPERKIYIVDSLCASSGYGLFMDKLADLRDEGMDIDALKDWAEGRPRQQDRRLRGRAAGHLPPAACEQPGPAGACGEDPLQKVGAAGDAKEDGSPGRERPRL